MNGLLLTLTITFGLFFVVMSAMAFWLNRDWGEFCGRLINSISELREENGELRAENERLNNKLSRGTK